MASTSTNKQPLLIDRPLHIQQTILNQKTGNTGYWLSNNSCTPFIDCTQNDGALIEDLYIISREATQHNVSFFMSNTIDFLRENDTNNVTFVTRITSSVTPGEMEHAEQLPYGIAPYPSVAISAANSRKSGQFMSLYIPRGKALWVGRAVESDASNLSTATGPVVGAQGGFY